jgi:DNA-binding MarR family transcriptional regulator
MKPSGIMLELKIKEIVVLSYIKKNTRTEILFSDLMRFKIHTHSIYKTLNKLESLSYITTEFTQELPRKKNLNRTLAGNKIIVGIKSLLCGKNKFHAEDLEEKIEDILVNEMCELRSISEMDNSVQNLKSLLTKYFQNLLN